MGTGEFSAGVSLQWTSIPEGVGIFLVASCYRNRPYGSLGSYADIALNELITTATTLKGTFKSSRRLQLTTFGDLSYCIPGASAMDCRRAPNANRMA